MSNFFEDSLFEALRGHNAGDDGKPDEVLDGEVVESDNETEKAEAIGGLLEILSRMSEHATVDDDDDDDDYDGEDANDMDANDFHNKACDLARHDKNRSAANICIEGLKLYPANVDLLADTIKYSSNCGDFKTAETHYCLLRRIPFSRWNWRAFTFSCDYLRDRNPVENEKEYRLLVAQYKQVLPYEEKASVAESELETALGNHDQAVKVLANAIQHYSNASQCALRLADMQIERGMYADVVDTCSYGIAASAEPQPSINIPYLLFLRAIAKDNLLHMKVRSHDVVPASEVQEIMDEYKLLLDEFPARMMHHSSMIKTRRSVLKFIRTED